MTWNESDHPRNKDGEFTDGNGDSGQKKGYDSRKDTTVERLKRIPKDFFGKKRNRNDRSEREKIPSEPKDAFGFLSDRLTTKDHLEHQKQMGFKDPKKYEAAAIAYWKSGEGKKFYSPASKRFYKYRKDTEEFLSIDSEGMIRTYFYLPVKSFERKIYQERLYEI